MIDQVAVAPDDDYGSPWRNLRCRFGWHDFTGLPKYLDGKLFMRCRRCPAVTPGWEIAERRKETRPVAVDRRLV